MRDDEWGDDEDKYDVQHDITDPVSHKPRLLAAMCANCVMRSPRDGQIKVGAARIAELIRDARAADSFIVCHATIYTGDEASEQPAACRGFYDRYSTNWSRIFERLGGFVEVPVPAGRH